MRKRFLPSLDEDSPEEPLINLTPLIDVVFVVLISFILIAPVLDIDSIALAPSGQGNRKEVSEVRNGPLSIAIRSDHSIWFLGRQMDLKELEKNLRVLRRENPNEIPQLFPDAESHFERYQQVKNVLEACGFEQVDIFLKAR